MYHNCTSQNPVVMHGVASLATLALVCSIARSVTLYGVATASLDYENDQAFVEINPKDGSFVQTHKLLDSIGGIIPSTFVVMPALHAAAFVTLTETAANCINVVDLTSGNVTHSYCSKTLVIDNVAYDTSLKQLFFSAFDTTKQANGAYELKPTGEMVELVPVGGLVQVGINAYSQKNHTFYVTLEDPNGGDNVLVGVDMLSKRVVHKAKVSMALEALAFDDTNGVLLGWGAGGNYAGILLTIDVDTGSTKSLLSYEQYSANSCTAVVGRDGNVYAPLLLYEQSNNPVWSVATLASPPSATFKKMNPNIAYPWILGVGFLY